MSRSPRSWWRRWLSRFGSTSRRSRSPRRQRPFLEALEDRWLLSPFVVSNAADSGADTLRDAINQVNAGFYNEIDFQIGAVGSAQTISLLSSLPAINQSVYINGLSQGGPGNTTQLITLNRGADFGATGVPVDAPNCSVSGLIVEGFGDGIAVYGSDCTIGGTTAGAGNIVCDNADRAVLISDVSGTLVQGNYLGTFANGTPGGNGLGGVLVQLASTNTTIGGTTPAARNIISGNPFGVATDGSVTGVVVQGNYIGTDVTGASSVGNETGVIVSASNITIGGTAAGAGNVISGNTIYGVDITNGVSGTQVQGNLIGTDVTGNVALGNGNTGVFIDNSTNTTIGGTTAGARNVISGNLNGVVIDTVASGVAVQGNYIGTNAAGNSALGNTVDVDVLSEGTNDTIGGTSAAARNVISGTDVGVILTPYANNDQLQGNYIGTDATGTFALQNRIGVQGQSSNSTIGGTAAGAGNLISGNNVDGIELSSSGGMVEGNLIGTDASGNNALGNGGAGIEIVGNNNTIGGTTAGARNIISGNLDGVQLDRTITGILVEGNYIGTNAAGNAAVANSFGVFVADTANTIGGTTPGARNVISGNTTGVALALGGGVQVLGNYIGTDATGTAAVGNSTGIDVTSYNDTIGGTVAGARNIISGNSGTGLFLDAGSSGAQVQGNYIGTNAAGTSDIANSTGVAVLSNGDTIGGTAAGVRNIISGNLGDGIVLLAGSSGALVQGNYIGTNSAGNSAVGNGTGIEVQSNYSATIGGTSGSSARNVLSGNDTDGLRIDSGVSGILVQGNYIGTVCTGTAALGNDNGVEVAGTFNTLGGTTANARNVISANASDGLLLGSGASGNLVFGNYIGTAMNGTTALGNGGNGVEVVGTFNTLGGSTGAARNIFSGNNGDGVLLDSTATNNQLQSNYIGTTFNGSAALANGQSGVEIAGNSNTVGGSASAYRNVISGNAIDGILLGTSASGNQVLGNYIGTSSAGSAALGNGGNGVEIAGTANTLGGTTSGSRNIIAANDQDGVLLGSQASGNLVQANYIGTNSAGTAALGNVANGIEVLDSNNTIGGTAGGARNVISGNGQDGLVLASGVSGLQVQGNYIGTNASGNAVLANGGNGIEINGASNTIGGIAAGARNVISGNDGDGVLLNSGASGVLVQGNYIGTDASGSVALGNSGNGIEAFGTTNTLGGSTASAHNVISGNGGDGVLINSGGSGVVVQGNYIGTSATGRVRLGNSGAGVEIGDNNAVVGGTIAAARNIISGNSGDGVLIDDGVSGALVQGNYIGADVTGTASLSNYNGIEVSGTSNTLGGTTAGARNVISGNANNGVQINSDGSGNLVRGNYLGTNASATAALANSGYGVSIAGNNNSIGGTLSAASNTIAFNSVGGVLLSAGSGNSLRRNVLYANGPAQHGPGIVQSAGANNNLAAPTVSTAHLVGSTLTVTGTFTAPTANVPYVLEIFASPAGDAEGKVYLGRLTVTPSSAGVVPFTFTVTTTATGANPLITATLTDNLGDTSAFSSGVTVS